jgi:hypothetical protein
VITNCSTASPPEDAALYNETWTFYPDFGLERGNYYPGDSRAALAPLIAHLALQGRTFGAGGRAQDMKAGGGAFKGEGLFCPRGSKVGAKKGEMYLPVPRAWEWNQVLSRPEQDNKRQLGVARALDLEAQIRPSQCTVPNLMGFR